MSESKCGLALSLYRFSTFDSVSAEELYCLSAFIALIGNIITAKMARTTAKVTAEETANKEIEKLERTWEREDLVSSDDEFAEMAAAVVVFATSDYVDHQVEALAKIATVRSKEFGTIAPILDQLYTAVKDDKQEDADTILSLAIDEKRRIKENQSKAD